MYQPTRSLIRRVLGRFGVTSTLLSIDDLAGLERVLGERPVRVIVFESPTNPVLKVADIARHHRSRTPARRADAARQHARRAYTATAISTSTSTCTA